MLRKTLTVFSLVGLLLTIGLWGASYHRVLYQSVTYLEQGGTTGFSADLFYVLAIDGKIQLEYGTIPARPPTPSSEFVAKIKKTFPEGARWLSGRDVAVVPEMASWQWLPSRQVMGVFTTISLPVYLFSIAAAVLPCFRAVALHRRRKRQKLGLCVSCGYDLRGSNKRCPECGTGFPS